MAFQTFIPEIQKLAQRCDEPSLLVEITEEIKKGNVYPYFNKGMLFVLKPMLIGHNKTMFVWLGIHKIHERLSNDIHNLEIMAKFSKCTHIRFESKRKGFKRYAPKFGYVCVGKRKQYDIYEKKVA